MDLSELEAVKKSDKKPIPAVRIRDEVMYEKLKKIAENEDISIVKLTEFFLKKAIEDYELTKIGHNKKNISPEHIMDLIINLFDVHIETIKESHGDEKRMLSSIEEMKKVIIGKLLPYM